ncbi:hypothetical protein AA313_de0202156 [Arthrobotrys entomopaga]|nr:hypothetical protein AA313_de0202156 [Arthrobotrys entomopaga]
MSAEEQTVIPPEGSVEGGGGGGAGKGGDVHLLKDAGAPKNTKSPMRMIYDQMAKLFNNGTNDIFQMEFPARLLEKGNYQYGGSDTINAQQLKPPAVVEAEFRLSNDMYDISSLVGGANGSKLSERYREVLFSMVPFFTREDNSNNALLRTDQERIQAWLEEKVENFNPPSSDLLKGLPDGMFKDKVPTKYDDNLNPETKALQDLETHPDIPRVDLYQKLLDVYNAEKFRWVQFKNDARPKDFSNQTDVDNYDRMLSTYAPVIDAKLEALWTVLLIRGQYHRVRQYIGYVDVETASEALQRAKENLRASVARSIDDTEDIYPVVFTPANWAKYLSTNFKPEDLLSDIGILRNSLYDAEKNRATLLSRKNTLLAGKQDISKLQNAEEVARRALYQAQHDMVKDYGDTASKIIQLYFEVAGSKAKYAAEAIKNLGDNNRLELNANLSEKALLPISTDQFKKLCEAQANCLTRQLTLDNAAEAYGRAQLAAAQAISQDGSKLIIQLSEQIDSLTMDIEYYKKILGTADNPLSKPITPAKDAGAPDNTPIPSGDAAKPSINPENIQLPTQTDGASVWQEIVLTYTKGENTSEDMSTASVSHENWRTGLWFWSSGGSSDTTSAEGKKTHSTSNTDIKIAFRAMKVSITRPWLDAGLLAQTANYFRSGEAKISGGSPAGIKESLMTPGSTSNEDKLLPSFPTGFIVVKDIHIILSSTETYDESTIKDIQSSSQSGGGFLCFSTSKSSNSSEHRESAVVQHEGTNLSIKIPAPQIIGWICELTPEDHSHESYSALPPKEFESPVKPNTDKPVVGRSHPV